MSCGGKGFSGGGRPEPDAPTGAPEILRRSQSAAAGISVKWNTGGREAAADHARRSVPGGANVPGQRPEWLKVKLSAGENYTRIRQLAASHRLHTVCQSANCPNIGECWNDGHVTFMILGHICTRSCGFCDVLTGKPNPVDLAEPARVADAVRILGLKHVVLTSVDRDELTDGGASVWAATIRAVKATNPDVGIEVLVPDFKGATKYIDTVLAAGPDVYAHNLETVRRLQRSVRPQASYGCSLSTLRHAHDAGALTKSGIMCGLGETEGEIRRAMHDLADAGLDILTLGQYLQPSPKHLVVDRFVHPDEFARLKAYGESIGIAHVEAGPLVRSSYRAGHQVMELLRRREAQRTATPSSLRPE